MSVIVVTGAGGFVGRRLVQSLAARGDRVRAIDRVPAPAELGRSAEWTVADLASPELYSPALQGADCVIHLAAVTGKARPQDFQRINVEGTRTLLGACERAQVGRFMLMSSIAAAFRDRRCYPYAESKIAAEALVRASPLPAVIVRPTMILGAGSPIQASLEKLARLPVTPMFGDGRVRVQPIDVADAARVLAALAHDDAAAGATIEIGGPRSWTMRELMGRLRSLQGAAGAPRFVHLPLSAIRSILAALEGPLLPLLPLTAGQLASFANDSVAAPHPLAERLLVGSVESPAGPARGAAAA